MMRAMRFSRALWEHLRLRTLCRVVLRYVVTLFLASLLIFIVLRLIPGDPASISLGLTATPEVLASKRHELGTDRPIIMQYVHWIGGFFRGHLGVSLTSGQDYTAIIMDHVQVSLILILSALLVALLIAVPLGAWAGIRAHRYDGFLLSLLSTCGIAIPSFLTALILIALCAVRWGWFPAGSWVPPAYDLGDFAQRLVLPTISLAAVSTAILMSYMRTATIDLLDSDYVRTARAKGIHPLRIVCAHLLPGASYPLLTVLGVQASSLIVGAVMIERIFVIPGIGSLLLDAVSSRDLPIVQSIILLLVIFTVTSSTIVDLLSVFLDPRVSSSRR